MPAGATSRKLAVAVMAATSLRDSKASMPLRISWVPSEARGVFAWAHSLLGDCLTLIGSLPFFAECKRESYDFTSYTGFLVSGNRPVH
jgi:hypothetical protein